MRDSQKVESVRIFEELLREVGLLRWERLPEIGDGGALPAVDSTLNLNPQDVAAPAVFDGLLDVPEALRRGFYFIE